MLEDVLMSVLGQQESMKALVRKELARLLEKGYMKGDPEAIVSEVIGKLEEHAAQARDTTLPLLKGVGESMRQVLDIPSRSEIVALTAALERHAAEGSGSGPDAGA